MAAERGPKAHSGAYSGLKSLGHSHLLWSDPDLTRPDLIVPLDAALARVRARLWAQLSAAGEMMGPHDLIVAAAAMHRRWALVTFNANEFRHVRGLKVVAVIAKKLRLIMPGEDWTE
jgi:predicted nucleic acid-binding protein